MVPTTPLVAREELERLVREYRHVREEHRHAKRGGRLRRRLGVRLPELEARFEHLLASLPLDDATREGWRDHLHRNLAPPEQPPAESTLVLEQGASEHWPARPEGPTVIVHARGVAPRARADLERMLGQLARLAPRPLLHARGSLEHLPDPALARPILAKGSLEVGGRLVRARAAAATAAEAVDLLEARLRRNLHDLAEREEDARRPGRAGPPAFPETPSGRIVRRTTYAAGPMTPEEAAWELQVLDQEFHLFTDETGEEALVLRLPDGTLGLKRVAGGGAYVEPFLVAPEPAPTLAPEEAIDLLAATGEQVLFFVERDRGRGAALYRRRDGDLGLVTVR